MLGDEELSVNRDGQKCLSKEEEESGGEPAGQGGEGPPRARPPPRPPPCFLLLQYLSRKGYSFNVKWFAKRKQNNLRGREEFAKPEAAFVYLQFDSTLNLPRHPSVLPKDLSRTSA